MGRIVSGPFQGIGRRSGLFGPNSREAAAADLIAAHTPVQSPRGLGGSAPATTEEMLSRALIIRRGYYEVVGPRNDDVHGYPAGMGPRVRWGLLSNGDYGIERWQQSGQRQIPGWVNA